VPYAGERRDGFPHSLEFDYLPLSALVLGEDEYDWRPLENLLDRIAKRGHQAVFRIFLEYPGRDHSIPKYLLDGGLKVHRYKHNDSRPPKDTETPDYSNPQLRACLHKFVIELGKRYDGDPRIGFITAGLLGAWGEWHTYPREELWASQDVQKEVLDAYESAFKKTPILLRYPAKEGDSAQVANAHRPFGYHDDSFAWATLKTGKPNDDWFFLAAMNRAGHDALNKWKTSPIGGEIRPEAWKRVFDADPGLPPIQDFAECVKETHVSWLMDSGMFNGKPSAQRRARAEAQVRKMGYDLHIAAAEWNRDGDDLLIKVEIENRGVAPFYARWPVEFALLTVRGDVAHSYAGQGQVAGLLPGDPHRVWSEALNVAKVKPGEYRLALRVANPLEGGHPLKFANRTQDQDAKGWLTLTPLTLR
jgi:hypothetical protein